MVAVQVQIIKLVRLVLVVKVMQVEMDKALYLHRAVVAVVLPQQALRVLQVQTQVDKVEMELQIA